MSELSKLIKDLEKESKSSLNKKELVNYLDWQIENIKEKNQYAGITIWVIISFIGVLFYRLVSIIDANGFDRECFKFCVFSKTE